MAGGRTIWALRAVVTANVAKFQQNLRRAATSTADLRRAWMKAGSDIQKVAGRIGLGIGAIIGVTAKVGISFNALKGQAMIAFEQMLGSAGKAKKMMAELIQFGNKTPFELRGLIKQSQKLLAFGFDAQSVIPILTRVGDAVAGLGGDPQAMESIVRVLGQVRAKGKLMAEEMLQLTETGVLGWQEIANYVGTDVPTAMSMATKGMIDGETAVAAILTGLDAKFGGMMAKTAGTFGQMLSNLRDVADQTAGRITEPLFAGMTRWMGELLRWTETTQFTEWVEKARKYVADFVEAADDIWPQLKAAATAMWGFVSPVLKFLAEHPRLAAMLLLLKGASMLGVIQAVKSLGAAILMTRGHAVSLAATVTGGLFSGMKRLGAWIIGEGIPSLMAWASGLTATKVAAFAAKAAIAALAIYLIHSLAEFIYESNDAIKDLNKALRESKELSEELNEKNRDRYDAEIAGARRAKNATAQLTTLLERYKKEQQGAKNGVKMWQAEVDRLNTSFNSMTGNKLLANAKADLEEAKKKSEEWKHRIQQVKTELQTAFAMDGIEGNGPGNPGGAAAGGGAVPGGGGQNPLAVKAASEAAAGAAEGIRQQIHEAQGAAIDRDLPGFSQTADMIGQKGMTREFLQQLLETNQGLTGGQAAGFAGQFQEGMSQDQIDSLAMAIARASNQGTKRAEEVSRGREGLMDFAGDADNMVMGGEVTQQQAAPLVNQMGQLFQKFRDGAIDVQRYNFEQGRLREKLQGVAQANEAVRNSSTAFKQTLEGLRASLPAEKVQEFAEKWRGLAGQLQTGKLSVDGFNNAVRGLTQAANEAAAAERRQALLKGDFKGAGLDFQKAMQERLAAFRMQQFNGQVDQAFNIWGRMNGLIPRVNSGLQSMQSGVQRVNSGLADLGGRGGGSGGAGGNIEAARANAQRINAALSTVQGQVASLRSHATLLATNLQFMDKYRDRKRITDQINSLLGRANQLQAAANRPVFTGSSGQGYVRDPGIQSKQIGPRNTEVKVELPNVNRINQFEIEMLVDRVRREYERQGERL